MFPAHKASIVTTWCFLRIPETNFKSAFFHVKCFPTTANFWLTPFMMPPTTSCMLTCFWICVPIHPRPYVWDLIFSMKTPWWQFTCQTSINNFHRINVKKKMTGAFARMQLTPYNPRPPPPPPKKPKKNKPIVKKKKTPKVVNQQLTKKKKIVWRKLMWHTISFLLQLHK